MGHTKATSPVRSKHCGHKEGRNNTSYVIAELGVCNYLIRRGRAKMQKEFRVDDQDQNGSCICAPFE
ncbi:hypothetical protein N7457_005215 [Penicillium paradoxum]|uniref:uncharacterized protein n=1 Tax=Penicillium paradoxum TaxID=176176 RepID=UPI00254686B4|nr:uncharacterized protein N7457_005215 [Penicillium paradoxum]KAJ5780055.1 hypothetical protein N7457_005215 [Penicillium paradoxum]